MTPANPQAQDSPPPSARDDVAEMIVELREAYTQDQSRHVDVELRAAAALESLQAEIARLRSDLACANTGGLKLLYSIRRELGWNDKTSLSIMDNGVRVLRVRVERVTALLANLQLAEQHYRATHDEFGDGHKYTGRAWDDLKREGNIARAALAEPGS